MDDVIEEILDKLKENNSNMQEEMARTWQKCDDYKSRYEKASDKIQYIIDYGFDYDGFNTVESLKGLIDSDKYTIRTLINKDNTIKVNVNDKYLKLFDYPEVKVKDDHSPVLVYEKGELVGLILPIKEY